MVLGTMKPYNQPEILINMQDEKLVYYNFIDNATRKITEPVDCLLVLEKTVASISLFLNDFSKPEIPKSIE